MSVGVVPALHLFVCASDYPKTGMAAPGVAPLCCASATDCTTPTVTLLPQTENIVFRILRLAEHLPGAPVVEQFDCRQRGDPMDEASKLRIAAQQARSFAENLVEDEARNGFLQLAEKWEAVADRMEMTIWTVSGEHFH